MRANANGLTAAHFNSFFHFFLNFFTVFEIIVAQITVFHGMKIHGNEINDKIKQKLIRIFTRIVSNNSSNLILFNQFANLSTKLKKKVKKLQSYRPQLSFFVSILCVPKMCSIS